MKLLRLVALVLAAATWTASLAYADGSCTGSATAAKGSCSAHATAHNAAAGCPATAACPKGSAQCNAAGAATAAAKGGCPMMSAAAKGGCSAAMAAQCTPAMAAQCNHAGAATAAASGCCGKGAAATATAANAKGTKAGGCAMHSASMAGCDSHTAAMHGDCSVCNDETTCSEELRAAGAHVQVIALRNGAMITYTTDVTANVRALQSLMARYHEHILAALASGSDASLCAECKALRGARQSGKFTRELVNVKNGCQVLMTSSDPGLVRRIHDMTGAQLASRTGKSAS